MINRGVFDILSHSSSISGVIPFFICIIRFRLLNKILKILFFYLGITVFIEATSYFLTTNNIQNYFIKNSYTFIECTCIFLMYYFQFKSLLAKKVLLLAYLFFFILSAALLIFMGAYNKPDNIINSLEAWMVIMTGSYYMFELYSDLTIPSLTNYYFTWVNIALLLYFSISLFMFLFNSYLERCGLRQYYEIYSLHLVGNITFNLLLTVGIWKTTLTQE